MVGGACLLGWWAWTPPLSAPLPGPPVEPGESAGPSMSSEEIEALTLLNGDGGRVLDAAELCIGPEVQLAQLAFTEAGRSANLQMRVREALQALAIHQCFEEQFGRGTWIVRRIQRIETPSDGAATSANFEVTLERLPLP